MSIQAARKTKLLVGGTAVENLTSLSLTVGKTTIDITNYDSGAWREIIGDIKSWSITASGFYDDEATEGANEAFDDLNTDGTVTLLMSTEVVGDTTFGGSGECTSFETGGDQGSARTFSVTYEGTGTLTKGTVA